MYNILEFRLKNRYMILNKRVPNANLDNTKTKQFIQW